MAADHGLDLRFHQSVEYGINLGPRDTKDMGDTLSLERADDEFCTGLRGYRRIVVHWNLLVRLLCVCQFLSCVFAEVGLEKSFSFGKS